MAGKPLNNPPRSRRQWAAAILIVLITIGAIKAWQQYRNPPLEAPASAQEAGLHAQAKLQAPSPQESSLDPVRPNAERQSDPSPAPSLEGPSKPEDWVVSGHLRLGKTGVLPGATIELLCFPGRTTEGIPLQTTTVTTDAHGRFDWALEAPTQTVTLKAAPRLEEHQVGSDVRTVPFGDAAPTDLEPYAYPMDCWVVGQVVDVDQVGLADALVTCTMNAARTDRLGNFRVPITTEMGQTRFQVSLAGFAPGEFAIAGLKKGENPVPTVVLQQGFALRGQVQTEAGLAIAGAQVSSHPPKHTRTKSDARGAFELTGLDPEARRIPITASMPGYVSNSMTVRRPKEGWQALPDPIVVLATGATVRGRVLDAGGQPIQDAWVSVGVHPSQSGRGAPGTYSGPDGSFEWQPLAAGDHSVWASRSGFAPGFVSVSIPKPVADVGDLEIVLDSGFSFWGQVLDEIGQPLPGVLLFPQAIGEFENPSGTYVVGGAATDREGRFRFENARYERIDLQVFADGYANLRLEVHAGEELVLRPKRAGLLAGQVLDATSGSPIDTFVVRFFAVELKPEEIALSGLSAGWSRPGMSFSDPEGRWSTGSEALPAGMVTGIEISAPGYRSARVERAVVLAREKSEPLRVRLHRE